MKINLLITENGNKPICAVQSKNKTNYIIYNDILDEIKEICNNYSQIYVTENSINISKDNLSLNIKNYKNNKQKDLDRFIKKLTKEFRELKKIELRKKKIRRVNVVIGTIILSAATLVNAYMDKESEKIYEEPENLDSNAQVVSLVSEKKEKTDKILEAVIEAEQDVEINKIEEIEEEKNLLELDYESRTETEKFQITKSYYKDKIAKISNEYGIDPQIMLAIATQECGIHDPNLRGPAIGLMQIERSVWIGETLSAFNYEKGEKETLNITEEKLKDLDFNIRVACMIFRDCYKNSNYNLPVAIQMYNFGYGNIKKTFNMAYDKEFKEMCNSYDGNWLEYRNYIEAGDSEYLEHIVSYIEDINNLECKKDNETIKYAFKNKEHKHTM